MAENYIHAFQSYVLMVVGLLWIGTGLWLGYDPLTTVWQGALAALLAMKFAGKLAHYALDNISDAIMQQAAEDALASSAEIPVQQ